MDIYTLQALLPVLLSIGGPAIGAVYTFIATKSARADKRIADLEARYDAEIEALEKRASESDTRLLKMEGEMKHLPDKELVTEIRLALAKLEGTVGQFGEKLSGVAHTVGLIDDTLRREPGR